MHALSKVYKVCVLDFQKVVQGSHDVIITVKMATTPSFFISRKRKQFEGAKPGEKGGWTSLNPHSGMGVKKADVFHFQSSADMLC